MLKFEHSSELKARFWQICGRNPALIDEEKNEKILNIS
jgi:hypothetical protein